LAKVAVELEEALARRELDGAAGHLNARLLAQGPGWKVEDVVCTSGPRDRSFEERHSGFTIAIVAAGSFQYRGPAGCELMTPGSLVLGNTDQCFECGHQHGSGDRCLSFWYSPEYFERIAADVGATSAQAEFRLVRVPPLRELSSIVAHACVGLAGTVEVSWDEVSIRLAARTIQVAGGLPLDATNATRSAMARVTRTVRWIERNHDSTLSLAALAGEARLSPYHFLRIFQQLTGLTPHQYVLRTRLREAAMRLASGAERILDVALDCGFGDVSNFNRAFRTEFGVTPRAYRKQTRVTASNSQEDKRL
jgi:AraC-like DNA-binding protein